MFKFVTETGVYKSTHTVPKVHRSNIQPLKPAKIATEMNVGYVFSRSWREVALYKAF